MERRVRLHPHIERQFVVVNAANEDAARRVVAVALDRREVAYELEVHGPRKDAGS